jgi:predicted O-methyltransferase YrrM
VKYSDIKFFLNGTPVMVPEQGRIIYHFLRWQRPLECLELGFAHGTSSCYIAAALQENDKGHLTTIDLDSAKSLKPSISNLLESSALARYVTPKFAPTSYIWELMKIVECQTEGNKCEPLYDFVYIDGAHTWMVDGFAFFLVSKLLKPLAWVLFDDIDWTFAMSSSQRDQDYVKRMPEEERTTPQIHKVFELLVRQHRDFGNFLVRDGWAWAQYLPDGRHGHKKIHPQDLYWRIEQEGNLTPKELRLRRKIQMAHSLVRHGGWREIAQRVRMNIRAVRKQSE